MSHNQTIDGVSRATLSDAFEELPDWNTPAATKLRALLDADKVNSRQMGLMQFVEAHPLKPADQPQGDPVAWMYRREGGECLGQLVQMESDNLKDVREGKVVEGRRILWPRDDYTDWKPLYAEQPAPVAVVLPERMGHSTRGNGWNACLDELKRLNPSL